MSYYSRGGDKDKETDETKKHKEEEARYDKIDWYFAPKELDISKDQMEQLTRMLHDHMLKILDPSKAIKNLKEVMIEMNVEKDVVNDVTRAVISNLSAKHRQATRAAGALIAMGYAPDKIQQLIEGNIAQNSNSKLAFHINTLKNLRNELSPSIVKVGVDSAEELLRECEKITLLANATLDRIDKEIRAKFGFTSPLTAPSILTLPAIDEFENWEERLVEAGFILEGMENIFLERLTYYHRLIKLHTDYPELVDYAIRKELEPEQKIEHEVKITAEARPKTESNVEIPKEFSAPTTSVIPTQFVAPKKPVIPTKPAVPKAEPTVGKVQTFDQAALRERRLKVDTEYKQMLENKARAEAKPKKATPGKLNPELLQTFKKPMAPKSPEKPSTKRPSKPKKP